MVGRSAPFRPDGSQKSPPMPQPSSPDDPHARPLDHAGKRAIVFGVLLPMFVGALDMTIVATALPAIALAFNDYANVSWIVTVYLLTATVVTPLYGKLSDIYGRRPMMLIALSIYLVGSLVCALAPAMWVLILGRVILGFGSGGLIPLSQTIIGEVTTPMERPRYQTYTATMFMVATLIGPALGGVLSEYIHWSAIFWINLPLGLLTIAVSLRVMRRLPQRGRPHRLDIPGAVLMVGAGLTLMLALTWGGRYFPWLSWQILGLAALSAALWAAFARHATRAAEPFVPLSVLGNRTVRSATTCGFFAVGCTTGLTIMIPLYLQMSQGLSGSASSVAVMVYQAGTTAGSMISMQLITRVRRYRRVPLAAAMLSLMALAVLVAVPVGLPDMTFLVLVGCIGLGLGPMFPLTIISIQNVITPREMGVATGVMGFFRSLGGTFVVAVFGAILLGGTNYVAPAPGSVDPQVFRLMFGAAFMAVFLGTVMLYGIEERPWRGPEEATP